MASSLFRSLSARFRRPPPGGAGTNMAASAASGQPRFDPKKQVNCKVRLLDGTDLNIVVSKSALGEEVYDQVFYTMDLEERDYFGLHFMDHYHVQHWLDPMKKLSKQVPIGPPYTFHFRVKFYTTDPASNLREELTRYLFFLQLKLDILTGKLPCPKATAVDLAAYSLQSELGDCDPVRHTPLFISEFRFHPDQDEQMEIDILEKFKLFRGQTPAQAEMNFLNKVRFLDMYGVDMHTVEGRDGNHYSLGLTPQGMLVFDGSQKIGLFFWEKIQKLDFKNKKLTLVVEEESDEKSGQIRVHTFIFNLSSHKACKHLWKCAIEHHTFFRLKTRPYHKKSGSQLFRLGSTFKYRGKTEYETVHKDNSRLSRRSSSTFERRPSQRYGPRQSHAAARQQRRDLLREQMVAQMNATQANAAAKVPTGDLISNLSVSEPQPNAAQPIEPSRHDIVIAPSVPTHSPAQPLRSNIPHPTTPATPPASITRIPVGNTLDRRILESPPLSDSSFPTSPTRNTRIPKYVVAPMQEQEETAISLTPPLSEPSTPYKEVGEALQEANSLVETAEDATATNTPNTRIPRPPTSTSKIPAPSTLPSTTTSIPASTSSAPGTAAIPTTTSTSKLPQPSATKIPKMASGGGMRFCAPTTNHNNNNCSSGFVTAGSGITYIPVMKSGIPPPSNRVITQL